MSEFLELAGIIRQFCKQEETADIFEAVTSILDAGFRRIPTEGPEWWGVVDKALEAWWCHFDGPYLNVPGALSVENNPIRKGLSIALRAALGIER